MRELTVSMLQDIFKHVADTIIQNEPYLTEIDNVIGDGDHGTGMKRGFTALGKMLDSKEFTDVNELCGAVGMELLRSMGGASGVIFCTMFFGGLDCLPHGEKAGLSELAAYFTAGEAAIEKRGKAKPGQKTMLDALYPAVHALKAADEQGVELEEAFRMAYEAALEGVEASKAMQSRVGRSKNFHEATIGWPDPGAVSTSLIFKAFLEGIISCGEREVDHEKNYQ
ncbi:dihydroxyacetone kinase subunit DhaL [Blautia schinkii]|nr:dihydroxyacetone kinase subunit DhaL [Blautia schinkii]